MKVKSIKRQIPKKMYSYIQSQMDPYHTDIDDAIIILNEITAGSKKNKMAFMALEELKHLKNKK